MCRLVWAVAVDFPAEIGFRGLLYEFGVGCSRLWFPDCCVVLFVGWLGVVCLLWVGTDFVPSGWRLVGLAVVAVLLFTNCVCGWVI